MTSEVQLAREKTLRPVIRTQTGRINAVEE